jgi:hypothetical protein
LSPDYRHEPLVLKFKREMVAENRTAFKCIGRKGKWIGDGMLKNIDNFWSE